MKTPLPHSSSPRMEERGGVAGPTTEGGDDLEEVVVSGLIHGNQGKSSKNKKLWKG